MMAPRNRQRVGLGFVLTLALSIFLVDQLAKYAVVSTMHVGEGVAVVPVILNVTHTKNPGAAAGNFRREGEHTAARSYRLVGGPDVVASLVSGLVLLEGG
jgi:lipoprotein signal peptidase